MPKIKCMTKKPTEVTGTLCPTAARGGGDVESMVGVGRLGKLTSHSVLVLSFSRQLVARVSRSGLGGRWEV